MDRSQKSHILKDLAKKMVFLVGPRQVGKTWLSKEIMAEFTTSLYLNYDDVDDRKVIIDRSWREAVDCIVFDEIHKMPEWKNYLKGVYDKKLDHHHILVTGSARLDTFQQFGDALSGRFFKHRLMPFSLRELELIHEETDLHRLIERSGFPEPYLAKSPEDAQRWRNIYIDGLIRHDVVGIESMIQLNKMSTLIQLLRRSIGSPLSYSSLSRDLGISSVTVKKYVDILEALFIVFRIYPFSRNIARSILKEPKLYFYDHGLVKGEEGLRFENVLAVSLLKHCFTIEDQKGMNLQLRYVRTKEKKEVDFCLVLEDEITQLIEVKLTDRNFSKNLIYFSDKHDVDGVQVVLEMKNKAERQQNRLSLRSAHSFLSELHL